MFISYLPFARNGNTHLWYYLRIIFLEPSMSQILNSSVIVKTKKSPQAAMLTRYHSSFEHELVGGKCPNSFFKYIFKDNFFLRIKKTV